MPKVPDELTLPRSVAHPGFLLLTRSSLAQLDRAPDDRDAVQHVLDTMGKRSMVAQGLSKPITSFGGMRAGDFRLYLSIGAGGAVRGLLKVGTKQLFVRRKPDAEYCQVTPLCVLDFYVHEGCQRGGVGSALFQHMLAHERADAPALGYDRPSPKLIAFLAKHHGLKHYTPQNNNFVLFEQFWAAPRGRPPPPPAAPSRPSYSAVARLRQQVGGASHLGQEMPHLGQENADPNAAATRPWSHRSSAPIHDLVLEAHSQAHSHARQPEWLRPSSEPPGAVRPQVPWALPPQPSAPPTASRLQAQPQPQPQQQQIWQQQQQQQQQGHTQGHTQGQRQYPQMQQMQLQLQMQHPTPQFGRRSYTPQYQQQPPPQQQQQPPPPPQQPQYQQKQPQNWSLGGIPGAGMGQPWGVAAAPSGVGGRRDTLDVYAAQQRARLLRRPF
jgi:GNAT superfamily N-acetyltransferase